MPSSTRFRRRLATVIATLVLAVPVGAAFAATESVSVVDDRFEPPTVTVTVGDTVEWTHEGSNPHTVTASDGSWDSHPDCETFGDDCMMTGETYSQDFAEVGEFDYYCKLHGTPDGGGMAGTVVVQAAQDSGGDSGGDTGGDSGETTTESSEEEELPETGIDGRAAAAGFGAVLAALTGAWILRRRTATAR